MIPSLASSFITLLLPFGVCLPSRQDQNEWALRVHNFSVRGPYLVGESISEVRASITLFNCAQKTRSHVPLTDAKATRDLQLEIFEPDGQLMGIIGGRMLRQKLIAQPIELRTGEHSSYDFRLIEFGYWMVRPTGRHSVQATLKMDGRSIQSPPIAFEVIELSEKAILSRHKVELEGRATDPPVEARVRPVIQQVQIGSRMFLFYSFYNGPAHRGTVQHTCRLLELQGKVFDLKVEGAYGDHNPLTITYRETTCTKFTTTHVINSVDGRPWTAEQEKHRQEKLKREGTPAPPMDKR